MTTPTTTTQARPATAAGERSWHRSPLTQQAQHLLRGQTATPEAILALAMALKNREKRFGYARKLLARARTMPVESAALRRKLRQQHALCTYKDPDLPAHTRLDLALEILQDGDDLRQTSDQETLGLAGAICKRKWEVEAQKEHLEQSLFYYLRGYAQGTAQDQGYTGINAAFMLDLLAYIETSEAERAGTVAVTAQARLDEASRIRSDLIAQLPPMLDAAETAWLKDQWWFYATVAEAFFGLRRYDEALQWLSQGKAQTDVPDWEHQSTATQLAAIARLHNPRAPVEVFKQSKAFQVLSTFLGNNTAAALTAYVGKVGLALSGGGFRASLFHIGVLAKLAELDVLRHVEVLSCVSGGAILGAHYYLELRKLLQEKQDEDITRDHYVRLVKTLQADFLAGVQKNIRLRIAAEFITNLKMIFFPRYSRTMRAGDLYERFLFQRVQDGHRAETPWWAPWRHYQRWLTDLYITPKGEDADFRPKDDNWRRRAKVPELILNATALNTGHNWQFTAAWMGEPPNNVDNDVDRNARLRRMYYWEAPPWHQKVRLGHAVAASACVPGLFEPLSLRRLYTNITVQLVDGGVHDNQGIASLLEQDANVLLISDASGQMETQSEPPTSLLGVPLRSNSILMSRVRAQQHTELAVRHRSNLLRGLMFVHLKQDLDVNTVDWLGCDDPHAASDEARPATRQDVLTRYGIRKDVQRQIAAIRTDLDAFCDAEAFALMTSGYRMTEWAFQHEASLNNVPVVSHRPVGWSFLQIEPAMQHAAASKPLMGLLSVARQRAFKVWKLLLPLKILAAGLALLATVSLLWVFVTWWHVPLIKVSTVGIVAITALIGAIFGKWVARLVQLRSTLLKAGIGVGLVCLGPLVVRLHLWLFDWLYLKQGDVRRIVKITSPEP